MSWSLYFVSIGFSLFFIFFVIELVRRGRLREQYSLLWLAVGIIMFIFSASTHLLFWTANLFGVKYAPSVLFLFGLICAFALLLHITVAISKHADRIIRLTQELAITQQRVQDLEMALREAGIDSSTETKHMVASTTGGES